MPFKDPEKRREAERRRRAAKRGTALPPGANPPPPLPPIALKSPADVLAMLEESVNLARADTAAGPQVRARTVGYLASVALRALEVGDLAERVKALEARAQGATP